MSRPVVLALSAVAIAVTLGVAVALIRAAPEPSIEQAEARARAVLAAKPRIRGVAARLVAGDVTVERTLPALTFRLEPGQALDRRLPAGPFAGTFTATLSSGRVRHARVGAWISGGSVIITKDGKQLVVEAADDEPVLAMSREPVFFGSGLQPVTFEFTSDGAAASSLRAMWQPEGATIVLPLPTDGAPLVGDPALRGLELVRTLHCAECHGSADRELQARLVSAPAPDLSEIGTRAHPAWIRKWLLDPEAMKPGAAMPALFSDGDAERVEDILHFLLDRTGTFLAPEPVDAAGLEATGALLYHQVGCVACHGALDEDAPPPSSDHVALGALGAKMTLEGLAAFLVDPLAVRPSGEMPSMDLTEPEARSIAAYLLARDGGGAPPATVTVDPERARNGLDQFARVGCANCHAMDGVSPAVSTYSLESLARANWNAGCTAAAPDGDAPFFAVSEVERDALRAYIVGRTEERCLDVPLDHLAVEMSRLRCTACHVYHGEGGADPSVERYFTTIGEADLGDEGRLPPKLGDAGAKLNPGWLREVLDESGRARPYLATRMPQYGEAVTAGLPAHLSAAAGVAHAPDHGPAFDDEAAEAGRDLVGDAAMNCIQCHDIAGRASTGTPGPDLALMAERLRFDAFARWLHDPARVRPGTRMPSFFVGGRSAFTDHYDGDVDEQVRAMWCYLSQGELLPLPDGLVEPGGLNIDVLDEPVVFRTFMEDAGVRAIACGFPEQVHCAFDADGCRLALVWQGPFLSASGAWAARGGSATDPETIAWAAPEEHVLRAVDGAEATATSFRGYLLDPGRRPIFLYRITLGGVEMEITEQPVPVRRGLETALVRRFNIIGPAGAGLLVAHGGQRFTGGDGSFASREAGITAVTVGADGRATFELEVTWDE